MRRPNVPRAYFLLLLLGGCGSDAPSGNLSWQPAFEASDVGWLLSAWGSSPNDVYSVGGERVTGGGRAMRFNGVEWSPVALGVSVPLLNWVFGFGSDDVWIAGDEGTVLHYDGQGWSVLPTPTDENLWGIWGASSNDMWAVGGLEDVPVILRWDGTAFAEVPPPEGMATWADWLTGGSQVRAFFKVWGTGADDVYVVGDAGTLIHWDGATYEQIATGTVRDLISLWGTAPDRIAVVGGRSNGALLTYDGVEWRTFELSPLPGLNGVWMGSPDVIHAVGEECTLATIDFASGVYDDSPCDQRTTVHAVFGGEDRRLFAVGGNIALFDGTYRGLALQRDRGEDE